MLLECPDLPLQYLDKRWLPKVTGAVQTEEWGACPQGEISWVGSTRPWLWQTVKLPPAYKNHEKDVGPLPKIFCLASDFCREAICFSGMEMISSCQDWYHTPSGVYWDPNEGEGESPEIRQIRMIAGSKEIVVMEVAFWLGKFWGRCTVFSLSFCTWR